MTELAINTYPFYVGFLKLQISFEVLQIVEIIAMISCIVCSFHPMALQLQEKMTDEAVRKLFFRRALNPVNS